MLCNDCQGTIAPDYNENDKVKITLLGYCQKCGCGIYKVVKLDR